MLTLLLLALSLSDPPVPLCLSVGEQTIAVQIDAPQGQAIRFSPTDRERIAAELRPLGVPEYRGCDRCDVSAGDDRGRRDDLRDLLHRLHLPGPLLAEEIR